AMRKGADAAMSSLQPPVKPADNSAQSSQLHPTFIYPLCGEPFMVYALPGQDIDWSQPRLPIPKEMQSFNLDDLCTCPSCGLQRLPETLDQKLSELVPPKVNNKFSSFKSFNESFKPNSNTIGTRSKATASDTSVASAMPPPGDASKSVKHYKTKAFGAE